MAVFVVTNPTDSLTNGALTPHTLRWAVERADRATPAGGPSVIAFGLGATQATITLTQGPLELSNTTVPVAIVGPLWGGVAVSGNDASQILQVDPGVKAAIVGLKMEHGRASNGGAIGNRGDLTVLGCSFHDNNAPFFNQVNPPGPGGITTGVSGPGTGGAIDNSGTLSLADCTLTGNSANYGGAIDQSVGSGGKASLSLVNCTLSDNSAVPYPSFFGLAGAVGGALNVQDINGQSTVSLTRCTISGNTAGTTQGDGGGINSANLGTGALLSLKDCTLSGNSTGGDGGGIETSYGTLTMDGCTISGNTAGGAGGGASLSGTDTQTDCTVAGNTASQGGGIEVFGTSNLALVACTVSGNTATNGPGGGLGVFTSSYTSYYGYTYTGPTPQATLTDTIVAGNLGPGGQASDIGGNLPFQVTGSYNLIGTGGSGGLSASDHNLLDAAEPGLAPLGDQGGPTQTMALLPGSPAIHAGVAVTGVTTDQRGRPLDNPVDIGAYQRQPVVTPCEPTILGFDLDRGATPGADMFAFAPAWSGSPGVRPQGWAT